MSAQQKMSNNDRKKRGGIYLALAAVSVLVYAILPDGLIGAAAAAGMLIFFIGGVYYLITGFTKKD